MNWGKSTTLNYLIDHSEHSIDQHIKNVGISFSYLPNHIPSPDISIFHFPSLSFYFKVRAHALIQATRLRAFPKDDLDGHIPPATMPTVACMPLECFQTKNQKRAHEGYFCLQ